MKLSTWQHLIAVFSIAASLSQVSFSQTESPDTAQPTFRVESQLALVDVIAEYSKNEPHTRELLPDLKLQDFRVFEDDKETSIRSFDAGANGGTRPIALWFIVQCRQKFPPEWHSDFMRGKTQHLRPAFTHLDTNDAIGVAHWCDDGTASIDLPPGQNPGTALAAMDELLNQKPVQGEDRSGELAMQKMIRAIVDNVRQTKPDRLPVLLFLYGDHCATYPREAEKIIGSVLETSGVVFGMSDGRWPFDPQRLFAAGQIYYLIHYYSQETGGQYYTATDPKMFSAALDYILSQLHLRYTIGFKPRAIDGRKHTIRVELTKDTQKRYQGVQLRFRQEYLAVAYAASRH